MAWLTISAAFFVFCSQALMNATLRRFCWETTRFCPIDHLCRFVPTLSQQLWEDFALIFGIRQKSLYLCRRKQVATASEGCGSAKLEQVRLCVLGLAKRPKVERALHFTCIVNQTKQV